MILLVLMSCVGMSLACISTKPNPRVQSSLQGILAMPQSSEKKAICSTLLWPGDCVGGHEGVNLDGKGNNDNAAGSVRHEKKYQVGRRQHKKTPISGLLSPSLGKSLRLDFCKGLVGNRNPIGHFFGNTANCKAVLRKAARNKRKSTQKKKRKPRPHFEEVSNYVEGPEEVVYYDEEFYTDVNGNIVEDPTGYNEDSFSQQPAFYSTSEHPDFSSEKPEFSSQPFYEEVDQPLEVKFEQPHLVHGDHSHHASPGVRHNQGVTQDFTIKPYVHESFGGVAWSPSSPDPNSHSQWTTEAPPKAYQAKDEPFVSWATSTPAPAPQPSWTTPAPAPAPQRSWTTAAPPPANSQIVWTTFAPQVVTVKRAQAPPPTDQTQALLGEFQVTSNPWPSQFTSDVLKQVGKLNTASKGSSKTSFASSNPQSVRPKKEVQSYPNSFFASTTPQSLSNNEGSQFQNSFFASPAPHTTRLKKEVDQSQFPKSFLNLGHQPTVESRPYKPHTSIAQAQVGSLTKGSEAFKTSFFDSPVSDTVELLIPDPLSPGHPQGNGNHGWAPFGQRDTFLSTEGGWEQPQQQFQKKPKKVYPVSTSTKQQWRKEAKAGMDRKAIKAQWESALQRELPQGRNTGGESGQERKWEQPTAKPVSKWEGEWGAPAGAQPKAWQKRALSNTVKVAPTSTTKRSVPKIVSPIQEWAQKPLQKFAEIPSFESMREEGRKTITTINKWKGPTTTTGTPRPRTASYSPVTKPSAVRSFPTSFPGTPSRNYDTAFNSYNGDADLSHLIGPTGAPGIAYIHTDAPRTAQQLQQLGQVNINSNSHYMSQNPFLGQATPKTAHNNIFLGTPTPASATVKRNINQDDLWTYNPTTERSVVKSYTPFQNSVWNPPTISEASSTPVLAIVLPNINGKADQAGRREDEDEVPHETASKITGYSYKSVNFPERGGKEGYNSFHYATS